MRATALDGVDMDIAGTNRAAPAYAPAPVEPVEKTAEAREVVQAVKALNGVEMFGPENELRFQLEPQTKRLVVRVVNRTTGEVVTQVPAEHVLRLAEDAKKAQR